MICLTHIPKTGGTTFRHILINNYSWRHYDFPGSNKTIIKGNNFPFDSFLMKHLKSMSGHWLRYSDSLKYRFPETKFIVFLRDPISRIISLFYHIKRYEKIDLNFREWVERDYKGPILSNFQTRFIAGECNLDRAKSILQNGYFFTGITEKFDKSLLIFKRYIGNETEIRYEIKRKTKSSKDDILEDSENKEALEILYKQNEIDLHLHEYVKNTLFNIYQKKIDAVTENDITEFRKMNNGYKFNNYNIFIFKILKYILYNSINR